MRHSRQKSLGESRWYQPTSPPTATFLAATSSTMSGPRLPRSIRSPPREFSQHCAIKKQCRSTIPQGRARRRPIDAPQSPAFPGWGGCPEPHCWLRCSLLEAERGFELADFDQIAVVEFLQVWRIFSIHLELDLFF